MTVRIPRSARTTEAPSLIRDIITNQRDYARTVLNQQWQMSGGAVEGLEDYKRRIFKRGGK